MDSKNLRGWLQEQKRMAEGMLTETQHAIEGVDQLSADGIEDLGGSVCFALARLEYELGVVKGHALGSITTLKAVLKAIDAYLDLPREPLSRAIAKAKERFHQLEGTDALGNSDAMDNPEAAACEAYWLGLCLAAEITERATGTKIWGYYTPGETEATDEFFS